MSVIKINAISVPADAGDEVARRFASRAGTVEQSVGRTTWLVMTRWRDEASFDAWRNAPAFQQAHAGLAEGAPQPPVAMHAELWSYEVELSAGPAPS